MKRLIIWLLALVFAAQQHAYTVVMVSPRGETQIELSFKEELQRLVVAKVNYIFIKPNLDNKEEVVALPGLIRSKKPDLIYTWGTPTTLAVAGTIKDPIIKDIPIVFSTVANPVQTGIVSALNFPGRNVTGVQHLPPLRTQLVAMQEYMKFKKLGVVFNPTEPNVIAMLEELKVETGKLGLTLITMSVDLDPIDKTPISKSIPQKISALKKMGAEWLYLGPDTFIGYTHRKLVTFYAVTVDLPTFTANQSAIRDGFALYGLYSPVDNLGKYAASKAGAILLGQIQTFQMPVDTLQKFQHVVNLCVANAIRQYPSMKIVRTGEIMFPKKNANDTEGCEEIK